MKHKATIKVSSVNYDDLTTYVQWPPKIMGHPVPAPLSLSRVRSIYVHGCATIPIYTLEPTVHICKSFGGARWMRDGGRVPPLWEGISAQCLLSAILQTLPLMSRPDGPKLVNRFHVHLH